MKNIEYYLTEEVKDYEAWAVYKQSTIIHFSYTTDPMRWYILNKFGGIYFDFDTEIFDVY